MKRGRPIGKTTNVVRSVAITPELLSKMQEIKLHFGMGADSEVIKYALFELYRSINKYGGMQAKRPSLKVVREEDEENASMKKVILATNPYPKGLGGTIYIGVDGVEYCKFKTYNRTTIKENTLPLNELNKHIIDTQYFPDYDTVNNLLEQLKSKKEEIPTIKKEPKINDIKI